MAEKELDEVSVNILKAMQERGAASGCGDLAKHIGVPTSQVVCRIAPLKKRGLIEAGEKSKYVLTAAGTEACG